ncbi:MAG: hypothetical protein L0227_15140, partial [Chloroflexi bacterium]|nr:hypothetical protein [Chloroflexota bacterium]
LIHVTVQGWLSPLQYEKWRTARAKLEAEAGRRLSDSEAMDEMARLLLSRRADGTVPGRVPINGSF